MLGALSDVSNSEYPNAGDLLGLDGMENEELLGYLGKLDVLTRKKVVNKMTKMPMPSQGSRAEMEKFFAELPPNIKDGLLHNKLKLADMYLYSIKPVNGSKTIKMFESQDVKEVGLRNVSNARLPKNMVFVVSGIVLLQGVAATTGSDDVKSANYTGLDAKGALATGEITLKSNQKAIMQDTSLAMFRTSGFTNVPVGYYKLANPRIIQDDLEIECNIELGTVTGITANTYFFLGLHGTATIPY